MPRRRRYHETPENGIGSHECLLCNQVISFHSVNPRYKP
jgi:hypothetical protein